MFCPKCGCNVEDEVQVCPGCGYDFSVVNPAEEPAAPDTAVQSVQTDGNNAGNTGNGIGTGIAGLFRTDINSNTIIKLVFFGMAAIVLIMFFVAASKISGGGREIMRIQSVGGKTLDEAYYAELGGIYAGYAVIARALGIFFASVLAWMGLKK